MANRELDALFALREYDLKPWVIGKIPHHFKRLSIPMDRALEYAKLGATKIATYYGHRLFFCQALIAGAILSGDFDEFVIVTSSQYGKSWLLGRVALLKAYMGRPVYIAGAVSNVTDIIMKQTLSAVQEAAPEVQNALTVKKTELERLSTSVSKKRLGFLNGGFVEPITLGDTYADNVTANQAVGRAGDFFIDEAANVSENAFAETSRREFAQLGGKKYQSVMISNPHKPGLFYDKLTQDDVPERTFILWIDALTAVEEERFTQENVFESDFARVRSTLRRYLLCVLDSDGSGMFDAPKLYQAPYKGEYVQYFLGVDAAYKGKDNLCIALTAVSEDGKCHVEDIAVIPTKEWIDGVTSEDIIQKISRVARDFSVSFICVDVGWGVWLVEGLAKRGLPVLGINFSSKPTQGRVKAKHYAATNASNIRAEMHLDLQNLIEEDAIEIDYEAYRSIKDALPLVVSERLASGKIRIRPKSEVKMQIGKSPDELDAVLLSIHAAMVFTGM